MRGPLVQCVGLLIQRADFLVWLNRVCLVFEQVVGIADVNKVLRVRLRPLLEDDGDVLFELEGLLKPVARHPEYVYRVLKTVEELHACDEVLLAAREGLKGGRLDRLVEHSNHFKFERLPHEPIYGRMEINKETAPMNDKKPAMANRSGLVSNRQREGERLDLADIIQSTTNIPETG